MTSPKSAEDWGSVRKTRAAAVVLLVQGVPMTMGRTAVACATTRRTCGWKRLKTSCGKIAAGEEGFSMKFFEENAAGGF